jgi:polyisoprenoid-binding protein YceI
MTDRTRRWLIRGGVAVVLLVALVYGAIFFYANVLNDSPDEFDDEDLTAAVNAPDPTTAAAPGTSAPDPAITSTAPTVATDTTAPATTGAPPTTTPATEQVAGRNLDGAWQVTDASEFGYRVEEVLLGVNTTAVGRGDQIDGSLAIAGTTVESADFTVDVASISSDEGRRDDQFRGRIMETDQFPTATFSLTEPVDFGAVPEVGEQVQASVTGDLTLHGVTQTVTFDVTAEAGRGRFGVLGAVPILFADYQIDNPSVAGGVTTEDNGLLEFVLVFERAA